MSRLGLGARVPAALVSLLSIACGGGPLAVGVPDLPDDVAWLAVLALDASGRALATSGLVRRGSPSSEALLSAAVEDGAALHLVGYTDAQLAGFELPDATTLAELPLAIASAIDPVLPAPRHAAVGPVIEGEARLARNEAPPELTVAWLPRCPRLGLARGSGFASVSCAYAQCEPILEQVGCEIDLDASSCGLGTSRGQVDGRGRVRFPSSPSLGTCDAPVELVDTRFAVECRGGSAGRCRIEGYLPPFPPRFEVDTLRLISLPDLDPTGVGRPPAGRLGEVVVLATEVMVVGFGGASRSAECSSPDPSRLHFVHAEDLVVTRTATAPSCLFFATRDPGGGGFLATYGHETPMLGRFDARGRRLAAVPLEHPALEPQHRPHGLVALGAAGVVSVAMATTSTEAVGSKQSVVLSYELGSLRPVSATDPLALGRVRALAPSGPDELLLGDDANDLVAFLEPRSAEVRSPVLLRTLGSGMHADVNAVLRVGDQVVIGGGDEDGGLYVFPRRSAVTVERAAPGELRIAPTALGVALGGRHVVVGAMGVDGARPAVLGLLDLERVQLLPGLLEVGRGPVRDLEIDDRGRVWATLPWSSTVLRIRPLLPE